MANSEVVIKKIINAPVERVWRAWTNPDDLQHWFTADAGVKTEIIQFDVKIGGQARLKFPGAAGEYTWTYVKIKKPSFLVIDILDFSFPEFLPDGVGGICNISFKDLGGKTEVTVSGELPDGWDDERSLRMAEEGWGSTLDKLNNYLKEK